MMGTRDESMIGVASVKDITTNKQVLSLSLSLSRCEEIDGNA